MQLGGDGTRILNGLKMQPTYLLVVVLAVLVQHTFAGKFPDIIQKCKVSDPKFDECALKSGNSFLSTLMKGDEKYGISPMVLNTTETYNISDKFCLTLSNLSSYAVKEIVLMSIHFDFPNKVLTFSAHVPTAFDNVNYNLSGVLLDKPFHQSGKLNITYGDLELNATLPFDFVIRDAGKYLEAVSCKLASENKNSDVKSYDKVGEPLSAEQMKEYDANLDKLPEYLEHHNKQREENMLHAVNYIFGLKPFEELFLP